MASRQASKAHERIGRIVQQVTPESQGAAASTSGGDQKRSVTRVTTNLSSRQKKLKFISPEFFESKEARTNARIYECDTLRIDHLSDYIPNLRWIRNDYKRARMDESGFPIGARHGGYTRDKDVVLFDIVRSKGQPPRAKAFKRAGARQNICWDAAKVSACIMTCGGLCPGLNVVINELVHVLTYSYGVDRVWGVRGGYRGLIDPMKYKWIKLTPESVKGINLLGGTILWSSRGGLSKESNESVMKRIFDNLESRGINQVYIIGGDGTHRGAYEIFKFAKKFKKKIAIAGIPKTIDNDMGVIDSSFGFNTAVEQATKAILSAVTEARCNKPNGIGIVKLMGRHAGYIAVHATLASRQVNMCLINEDKFLENNGPTELAEYIEDVVADQGHAVLVVSEGAGADYFKRIRKNATTTDASGNKTLDKVGEFLIKKIKSHFKSRGKQANIKYHDPSYMIRSVAANASDNVLCVLLAQNAVHGAMAGYTGFTSGIVNNRSVMIPIPVITRTSPSFLDPTGRTWARVLAATRQPLTRDQFK